ncbi:DUF3331 domain-containing protein [Burkholderia seminalis]|uniref:DUF3331 domain-containing protein n=1 Tax=Burkholderia seminalis TaxID=488731 RepID=UPI0031597FF2
MKVFIVERPEADILVVCWSDPRSGYYGDQIWRLRIASKNGCCALSGKSIRRGDLVFRPATRPLPRNADAMILSGEIPPSS